MTNRIEPALTPAEWKAVAHPHQHDLALESAVMDGLDAKIIALANHTLPDSDPRKITRGKLDYLREVARTQSASLARIGEDLVAKRLIDFADALESYLPPEGQSGVSA